MTQEFIDANFVRFERYFSFKMRILLVGNSPRIPQSLLELIRPKDYAKGLKLSHNWGDIIPCAVSTFFRLYGSNPSPMFYLTRCPSKLEL